MYFQVDGESVVHFVYNIIPFIAYLNLFLYSFIQTKNIRCWLALFIIKTFLCKFSDKQIYSNCESECNEVIMS